LARPKKSGLSYFPLDTDFFDNDSRIKILKARYRADGIMIYVYLLCEIYKNGYYIQVDDDLEYIIASELGVSVDKVKQVLNFLLKKSLFDSKLFSSDKVLTSAGIQKRDYDDSHRAIAPLKQAEDAVVIDSTYDTPEDVLAKMVSVVEEKLQ